MSHEGLVLLGCFHELETKQTCVKRWALEGSGSEISTSGWDWFFLLSGCLVAITEDFLEEIPEFAR